MSRPTVVELFAGAGGMAVGLQQAGFSHLTLVEHDGSAVQTLRKNAASGVGVVVASDMDPMDVRDLRYRGPSPNLLAAGVPCQPFSLAGNHFGREDERNLFPEVFRVQRDLEPDAVLIENVWGLARPSFRPYLEYILLQIALPTLTPRKHEGWPAHKRRLRAAVKTAHRELTYDTWISSVECANFGVPQRRHRLFIVAFRTDLDVRWQWPSPTHSEEGLLHAKFCSGAYWDSHGIDFPELGEQSEVFASLVASRRWRTVRDTIAKLPAPSSNGDRRHHPNHYRIDGARTYRGHTGSRLDEPSKTLKAGVHGVPGGENMLVLDGGAIRYFTLHEAALLQTFPRGYVFCGPRSAITRQIGNAAPARVVKVIGKKIIQLTRESPKGSTRMPHVDLLDGAKLLQL